MQRRGFLGAIIAAGFAPAFVGAKVLMPIKATAYDRQIVHAQDCIVYLNGIMLMPSEYVSNGHGLVKLKRAPINGDVLIVHKARQIDSFVLGGESRWAFAG